MQLFAKDSVYLKFKAERHLYIYIYINISGNQTKMLVMFIAMCAASDLIDTDSLDSVHIITIQPKRAKLLNDKLTTKARLWTGASPLEVPCDNPTGMLACTESHLRVLIWISQQPGDGWHLVFEDDVIPSNWVLQYPDWVKRVLKATGGQFINLGPSSFRPSVYQIAVNPIASLVGYLQTRGGSLSDLITIVGSGALAHAYMVSPSAAKKLTQSLTQRRCQVGPDEIFNELQDEWIQQVHLNANKREWLRNTMSNSRSGLFAQSIHVSDTAPKKATRRLMISGQKQHF